MGYRREDYIKANELLAERKRAAEALAARRLSDIHEKLPAIKEIDAELARTEHKIIDAIRLGPQGVKARMDELEAENLALTSKRASILSENGYPADYTEPEYFCPDCGDTGYVNGKMCVCKKRALVMAGYESSGVGALMGTQSFDTFSFDYYTCEALTKAKNNYAVTKRYAENFSGKGDGNLLFAGATGLGKTHLSTSVAVAVIERGFDVKYETAQNLVGDFEDKQFRKAYSVGDEDPTERYFDCDLLIIDDLGTEMTNQFTVSCLYNLINSRINRGKATIINTNLSSAELRRRYSDRITSRLFGEFSVLLFEGGDIRAAKLRK